MRILIIDPPGNLLGVNVGVGYLVGALKARGHDPLVLDLNNYRQLPWQDLCEAFLSRIRPQAIGISVMSLSYAFVRQMAERLRKRFDGPIILGGAHVTIEKGKILQESGLFDVLCLGEGEVTLPEVLDRLDRQAAPEGIPGVFYREGGRVLGDDNFQLIKDLDSIPFPDFRAGGVLEMERYPLLTSRGCPFHCIYCESAILHKRRWRPRKPARLIEELRQAIDTYRIRYFIIQDDNFSLKRDRALEFLNLLLEEKIGLPWFCTNGVRADTVTDELASLMRASGCETVSLGIESLDPGVFNGIKKGESLDDIRQAVRILQKHGFTINGLFIVGLPGDTYDKAMRTYREGKELGLERMFFQPLIPYPATEVYDWSHEHGRYYMHYQDSSLSRLDVVFDTPEFPRRQRVKAVHKLAMKSKVYPRDPDRSSLWNLSRILGMIFRYDPLGLPGHLAWLLKKGLSILRKGRLRVEATLVLDENHYRITGEPKVEESPGKTR